MRAFFYLIAGMPLTHKTTTHSTLAMPPSTTQNTPHQHTQDVAVLRSSQFSEDAGPMAHPIRYDGGWLVGWVGGWVVGWLVG